MEKDISIHLKAISKKYLMYNSSNDRLKELIDLKRKKYHREFWALKNIDLKIPRGQTVGILGLNGSGKSTLLQIISSVLHPSSGEIEVNGRVAALLELGAGFNPQLTGLENAKLNLAIQGVSHKKIEETIPIIRDFADIGDFFFQPVCTYSSGMFARLAFATAINVDPDILIIDEALSVGDAKFQQKCFKKFSQFQEAGKTILFVTHDRFSIARLCSMAVLLHKGELLEVGEPKEVVESYGLLLGDVHKKIEEPLEEPLEASCEVKQLQPIDSDNIGNSIVNYLCAGKTSDNCPSNVTYNKNEFRYGTRGASIVNYCLEVDNAINPSQFVSGSVLKMYCLVAFHKDVETPIIGYSVKSKDGVLASCVNSRWLGENFPPKKAGEVGLYSFSIDLDLCHGDWFVDISVAEAEYAPLLDNREGLIHLEILPNKASQGIAFLDTKVYEVPLRLMA